MADTKAVARVVPLKLTVDVATKPVPFTVKVVAGSPAVAELGLRLVMVDNGLLGAVQINAAVAELRGAGVPVVKSVEFWLVSLHPVPVGPRRTAVVLVGAGAGPVPSKALAVVP